MKFPIQVVFILVLGVFITCNDNETVKTDKKEATKSEKSLTKTRKTKFSLVPSSTTNIKVKNNINETEKINVYTYEYMYNGGGVAVGDINNDGLPDLFFTINMGINRLYLNMGDWQFKDISMTSNIQMGRDWSTGVTMVDINNDGWLDIYVCRSGKFSDKERSNLLFVNNKNNTFTEQSQQYGLDDTGFSTQASFFDYDNDGDLDMYLANHPIEFNLPVKTYLKRKANPDINSRDKLYRNDNGLYTDVSISAGINNYCHTLGLITTDINNDGWVDIYVSNDYYEADFYYLNNGDGTFTDKAKTAMKHMSKFSMGVDASDINNDGALDILTLEMMAEDNKRQKTNMASMNPKLFDDMLNDGFGKQFMHNCMQLNNGHGAFSEIAYLSNIATTDWSWSSLFADYDNDGYQDLFITNGYKRDLIDKDFKIKMKKVMGGKRMLFEDMKAYMPSSVVPNYIFKNNGDLSFTKKSQEWGIGQIVNSNGACYADLDLDGDLDIIVNNLDAEMSLFKNNHNDNHIERARYLRVQFEGPVNNVQGIGTKVTLNNEGTKQFAQLSVTRGFESSTEAFLHFGLGDSEKVDEIIIEWFDGKMQVLNDVSANQVLKINYEDANKNVNRNIAEHKTIFEDITAKSKIQFKHTERIYNDYDDQILLPHKLSQNGPGLAVGDVNGDQLDDFYVCGASGQSGVLFLQQKNKTFKKKIIAKSDSQYEDMGALFFDADADGDNDLYVVSGSYESSLLTNPYQDRLYINDGSGRFKKSNNSLPTIKSSGSSVSAGDYDMDGDLDLFVGGRVIPKKYPYTPESYLLRNDGGKFVDVTDDIAKGLKKVGMVNGGLWTDYDNDNDIDLIVVGEWMPIRIFNNDSGKFTDVSKSLNLDKSSGWWNSITGGDIDNDGDIDYVLGNLGLNSKNKASEFQPFEVYCDDFDGNGVYDIALGYYNMGTGICYPVRGRQCSSQSVPSIAKKIPTYNLFGESSISDVYGEDALKHALHFEVNTFESVVLVNNGKAGFKMQKLPNIAQIAPTYGIVMEDFNDDGCLDIYMVGNQLPVEVETGMYDAHKGVLLYGNCNAGFVSGQNDSGIVIDGDSKSLSMIKIGKNNLGMLISTNDGALRLIGLKKDVDLSFPNMPTTIDKGKAQHRKIEYYYGGGYLSQNSKYIHF